MKRKIGLLTALVLIGIFSQAQQKTVHSRGASFGLRAGVNFQNINGKDEDGNNLDYNMLTGFHAGINAEIPLAPQFYFQPGLLYTLKGAKSEEVILGETYKGRIKISYLELPLNFLYKPNMGTGHILLGFGPYVALGIGGKVKNEGGGTTETTDLKFKNKVKLSDPGDVVYLRPLDAGANMLAGYEFANRFSIQLNAQLGLTKINPEYEGATDDKTSAKNTGFGFSLGCRL